MRNLEIKSWKQLLRTHKFYAAIFLALGFVGFIDSSFLTAKHYLNSAAECTLLRGCEVVTTSKYATIIDVPVALLGAIYYLLILVLAVLYIDTGKHKFLLWAANLTALGFVASLWFVYLQAFVLRAYCEYCLLSAASSTILFITGLFYRDFFKREMKQINLD